MKLAAVVLAGCSFASVRTVPCTASYTAPWTDAVLATPLAIAAAVSPALAADANDHAVARTVALGAGAAVLIASSIYGFRVVDPDRCVRAPRVIDTDL